MAAEVDAQRPLVPSITVAGSDEVSAKADMAEIQIGIVTQAPAAAKALTDNNAVMEKIFKLLASHNIAPRDMQTSNLSVAPQYRRGQHGENQPEIAGYQVNNQLRVKVRDLQKLGAVLDEVVSEGGANIVHGISFSVAEPKPLLDEARLKAMADARRKAELYAKAAGVKVGRVLLIQEQAPHLPQPQLFGAMRAGPSAVPVAPGEQEFHASITVTFAIE